MDALYLYRRPAGGDDSEIRHSIRSLVNLQGCDHVWIVGEMPSGVWGGDLNHLHVPARHGDKFANLFEALLTACEWPAIPERFVLLNDDYHFLHPFEAQVEHRGPLSDQLAKNAKRVGTWRSMLQSTAAALAEWGVVDPMSYELHRPMPIVKDEAAAVLRFAADRNVDGAALGARTIYGALYGIGGEQVRDRKVRGDKGDWRDLPVVSTSDAGWRGDVGKWIRQQFPTPSRYEQEAAA